MHLRIASALLAAGALTGCASFNGAQQRLTATDMKTFAPVCPTRADMDGAPSNPSRAAGLYRDAVIMTCIKATNDKYAQFVEGLSREAGATNLATDLLSQGLSTAASVVNNASVAKKLSAGAALSLGVGASVNKDLFYKQTLPAIVASMEARRSKVLTAILKAQNDDPYARTYTLARAGYDLDLLQDAGSLTAAVRELTTAAVQNAAQADATRQQAERVLDIGTVQTMTPAINGRVYAAVATVRKLEADDKTAQLRNIAMALGLAPDPNYNAKQLSAIIRIKTDEVTTTDPARQEQALQQVEAALAPYKE